MLFANISCTFKKVINIYADVDKVLIRKKSIMLEFVSCIVVLFLEIGQVKTFSSLTHRIVICVSEYIFFVSNKKTHTQEQKAKETKENRRTKETKRRRGKKIFVAVLQLLILR